MSLPSIVIRLEKRRKLMINLKPLKVYLKQNSATSFTYLKLVRLFHSTKRRFPRSYSSWIRQTEKIIPYVEQTINNQICILLDADGINEKELITLVESVKSQGYPYWHLLICCSDSNSNKVKIAELGADDKRISYYEKDNNQVGCDSTSKNDWLLILTGDLLLSTHCFSEFNVAINNLPNSTLVYSDHDQLSRLTHRHSPNFKPDWNPDLYYTTDYIQNCCIYSMEMLLELKVVNIEFCRDFCYLLTLKISKADNKAVIQHVPKVLFHRVKVIPQLDIELAGQALKQTLKNEKLIVQRDGNNGLTVTWPIPEKEPLVSLIIPTRNGHDILKQAVDSIIDKTSYKNYEIIIVDNQSDCEQTLAYMRQLELNYDSIRILKYDQAFNYSAINNFAVRHTSASVIGFINNDVEVISPDWLTHMLSNALRPGIGCVGAKLYYANNTIQHAGVIVGMFGCAGHSHKHYKRQSKGYCGRLVNTQNYSAVTAACLLMRKDIFKKVNGFNETDLSVAFNDVDLCLKVEQLGLRNLWTPFAELYHHESISRGLDVKPEQIDRANKEIKYMHDTWNTQMYPDPAFNINLSLTSEDFSITRHI
jgi:GT2 family glycosyltransferase